MMLTFNRIKGKILQYGLCSIKFSKKFSVETLDSKPLYLLEEKENYAILKLNKPASNSLDINFLKILNNQLDKLEANKKINGVILTSNVDNLFSSGLDLNEVYQSEKDRLSEFWALLQELWIKLYGSNKIFIGAINGHAHAGGCLIAMCCDYRIIARGNYKIGISAARAGIQPPFWICETMKNTIGYRETEKATQLGLLYSPDEALEIKLVDEIVEKQYLIDKAKEEMLKWLRIPNTARELTKQSLRKKTINNLLQKREDDVRNFVELTLKESVQKNIGEYLDLLKKRKQNKN